MRILVTGAGGFVGRCLIKEFEQNGYESVAFDLAFATPVAGATASLVGDLCDASVVDRAVADTNCEACIHLGAISFVPAGDANPGQMFSVNVLGTINLLEALRKHARSSRLVVISTAHVYGQSKGRSLIKEDAPMAPSTLYAVSKIAADLATLTYARQYGMHMMTARPNNHIGPGQSPKFFVPSFASQIKAIAAGKAEPVLRVGNLDSTRDIMDVRDVARAYRLLIEKGHAGEAYNIASGNSMTIREVLERLCDLAGIKPTITVDPGKYRPTDNSPLLDVTRLRNHTGWKPEIDISVTLRDILAEA